MHYLPSPAHTKFWQERTPLAQYINNEVVGTRMRRWQRPIHDFLLPYMRGLEARLSDEIYIPQEVQRRRDLNTRSLHPAAHKNARAGATSRWLRP